MRNIIASLFVILLLNGCATAIVSGATATGAAIVQERSLGNAIDDAAVLLHIKHLYVQEDINELFSSIDVDVVEGRVLLTGTVLGAESRINAVRLAWQPKGVVEVINELQVSEKEGTMQEYAKDAWITAQIKSKYLLSSDIASVNYSVDTVNTIVYLMGIAQSDVELGEATHIASTIRGVTEVVSHVRLKDDPIRN